MSFCGATVQLKVCSVPHQTGWNTKLARCDSRGYRELTLRLLQTTRFYLLPLSRWRGSLPLLKPLVRCPACSLWRQLVRFLRSSTLISSTDLRGFRFGNSSSARVWRHPCEQYVLLYVDSYSRVRVRDGGRPEVLGAASASEDSLEAGPREGSDLNLLYGLSVRTAERSRSDSPPYGPSSSRTPAIINDGVSLQGADPSGETDESEPVLSGLCDRVDHRGLAALPCSNWATTLVVYSPEYCYDCPFCKAKYTR